MGPTLKQDLGGATPSCYDPHLHAILLMTAGYAAEQIAGVLNIEVETLLSWADDFQVANRPSAPAIKEASGVHTADTRAPTLAEATIRVGASLFAPTAVAF